MKKILIFFIFILSLSLFSACSNNDEKKEAVNKKPDLSQTEVQEIITKLLNNEDIVIKEITEEKGLFKIMLNLETEVIESYLTKDGELLFPQALIVEDLIKEKEEQIPEQIPQEINKTEKPKIELFVMSHCPYGTQIQKGLLPVAALLKDKIDLQMKFVDYAMHGEVEITEQLNQYCIQKNNPDKYLSYLQCFLEKGDSEECKTQELGTNLGENKTCINETDKEFQIMELFADQAGWESKYPPFNIHKEDNTKYKVGGSPTLVINETVVKSGRDSQSLLTTICSAFTEKPEECNQKLSSENPSAGFGFATGGDQAAAECGV